MEKGRQRTAGTGRHSHRGRILGILTIGLLLVAGVGQDSAWAQVDGAEDAPWRKGVSAEKRTKALSLLKQGNHFHERLQYSQALTYYRKALGYWNHPAIQFNIADCYINMDQPLLAYRAIQSSLRFGFKPLSAAQYKQAMNYRKLLRARLAEITVEAKQPGVQVSLDGKPFFKGPGVKTKLVVPGEHQVVGAKAKFVTHTSKISVFSGKKVNVRVHLTSVESLMKNRKVIYKRRWKVWKPWTVFAAGLLVAGIGVPVLLKARTDVSDFDSWVDDNCGNGCVKSDIPSNLTDGKSQAPYVSGTAIGLMAAGGATLAAGVVLLILNRAKAITVEKRKPGSPKPAPPTVQIVPSVGPGAASVSAQFRF